MARKKRRCKICGFENDPKSDMSDNDQHYGLGHRPDWQDQ